MWQRECGAFLQDKHQKIHNPQSPSFWEDNKNCAFYAYQERNVLIFYQVQAKRLIAKGKGSSGISQG